MSLDNIQVVNEEKRAKPNEGLITNSIKLKSESYDNVVKKIMKLRAERDAALAQLNNVVVNAVVEDKDINDMIEDRTIYGIAEKIAILEKTISIEEKIQGPAELIGNRAIRLIDKMIKNARANSIGIYRELDKKQEVKSYEGVTLENIVAQNTVATEPAVQLEVPVFDNPAPIIEIPTTPVVDVQKISEENQATVKESVETAIKEESLKDSDIENVVNGELGVLPVEPKETVEEVVEDSIKNEEIERVVNEKLNNFINSSEEIENEPVLQEEKEEYVPMTDEEIAISSAKIEEPKEEYEYVPMTDEEVAISRAKIEEDNYKNINFDKEIVNDNIPKVEEPVIIEEKEPTDVAIRDEVIVVPERPEIQEVKSDEYKPEEEKVTIFEKERIEPKSVVVSSDEKEKLKEYSFEELSELIAARGKEKEKLQSDFKNSEEELETIKRDYAKVVESEAAAEKKLEELKEQEEKEAAELKEMMIERVVSLQNENKDISDAIKSRQEEWDSIKEAGNKAFDHAAELKDQVSDREKQIAKYKEMKSMFSDGDQDFSDKIKTM